MKKLKSKLLTLGFVGILALSSALAGCGQNPQDKNPQQDSSGVVGSKEKNQQETAVEIGSRDDFAKIYDDLSASYILTADIDFGGETVNPVGIFEPKSDAEEDAETPNTALAFTGTFDGNGHTLSNIKIDAADKDGVGLFGCMTGDGSWVKNLKVENISVKGGNYTGGVVGFADFGSYVEGITLSGKNTVEDRFLIGGGLPGYPMRISWTVRQWQTLRSHMPICRGRASSLAVRKTAILKTVLQAEALPPQTAATALADWPAVFIAVNMQKTAKRKI